MVNLGSWIFVRSPRLPVTYDERGGFPATFGWAGVRSTVAEANAIVALRCCKLGGRFEDFRERRSWPDEAHVTNSSYTRRRRVATFDTNAAVGYR